MSETEKAAAEQSEEQKEFVEDGKNKHVVKCKYCQSKILDKKAANYIAQEKNLPLMLQDTKKSPTEAETELIKEFYHVENMMTFENIGFTHTVANWKYLSCADCDVGPLGYFETDTKQSYVALSRVTHST